MKEVFDVKISEESEQEGVFFISVVADPAIGVKGELFSEQTYILLDDIEQKMLAPVLIPERLILRLDGEGKEYYIKWNREVIQKCKEKFDLLGKEYKINLEHSKKLTSGIITKSYLTDGENSYKDLPGGTWMMEVYFKDRNDWEMIKEKGLNGFSVEALIDMEYSHQKLKKVGNNKIYNNMKENVQKKSSVQKMKDLLFSLLFRKEYDKYLEDNSLLEEYKKMLEKQTNVENISTEEQTENVSVKQETYNDMIVGGEMDGKNILIDEQMYVYITDASGFPSEILPQGEYTLATGVKIIVNDAGLITEKIEPSMDTTTTTQETENKEETIKQKMVSLRLESELKKLKEEILFLKDENKKLLERLSNIPASAPLATTNLVKQEEVDVFKKYNVRIFGA